MVDVPGRPGLLRRGALTTYGRLPRRLRLAVLHALAPSHTVGALCLVEHEGRLLMLRQHHRQGWTLPGGLVDRGEDAEQAVVRELGEETGLTVEVGLPFGVVVDPKSRRVDVLFHVPVERRPALTVSSEATEARWLTRAEAGTVDEPTAQAFAMFDRTRGRDVYVGRIVGPDAAAAGE
jgi:ADP-ribose pyrophosphatase YjhB (NUDIX family)